MALRFLSSMGEVHNPDGGASVQFLRYWGGSVGIGAAGSFGIMSNSVISDGSGSVLTPSFTPQATWIIGAMFRGDDEWDGINPQDIGLEFRLGAAVQLSVKFVPAAASGARPEGQMFSIEVRRGSTVLAASAPEFYVRDWHAIQFKATIDTVSGSFEVRMARRENETWIGSSFGTGMRTILSGSGINTADAAVNNADNVEIEYSVEDGATTWDHFFVFDSTGALNNDFPTALGGLPPLVQGVVPNADGVQNDWVARGGPIGFDTVNDPGNSTSDDTGRLTSEVVSDIVLVQFQIPGETGVPGNEAGHPISGSANVLGVIFHHVSGMENSGNRTLRPIYRNISNVRSEGASVVVSSTSFAGFFEVFELNPVSSLAWTVQQTKEMQWGLKLQA